MGIRRGGGRCHVELSSNKSAIHLAICTTHFSGDEDVAAVTLVGDGMALFRSRLYPRRFVLVNLPERRVCYQQVVLYSFAKLEAIAVPLRNSITHTVNSGSEVV